MDKGRFESAQRFYRRAIAIDPNDAGAHADLGRYYYAGGIFQKAIEQYRQAIRIDPGWDKPRIELAKAYWISNKTDSAMEELNALKRSNPKAGMDLEAWFRQNPPQHSNKQ